MDNSLQVFDYNGSTVRTVEIDGDVWFVAKDVCDVLEIKNVPDAVSELDDDEKMTIANTDSHSGQRGGAQKLNVVSESGLYALVFKSRKPEAKKFSRWVRHEVLPAIRKTGAYYSPQVQPSEDKIVRNTRLGFFTKGTFRAIEKIIDKAFQCKENEDFEAVFALDRVFEATHGYSVLQRAGLKLTHKSRWERVYITPWSNFHSDDERVYYNKYITTYQWEKPVILDYNSCDDSDDADIF